MKIDSKTLKDLEWSVIIKHLASFCSNDLGVMECHKLSPSHDIEIVQELLLQTTEARSMIQLNIAPSFGGIYNVHEMVQKCKIGVIPDIEEFINLASTLMSCSYIKKQINQYSEKYSLIYSITSFLQENKDFISQIYNCFDHQGNILDTASADLKSYRASLRDQTNNLKDKINSLINSSYSKYLQEPVYTIRNNRYVLPVKAEHKSDVPGIVHDSSASGVTYFIEPRSIVEMNNKIKETELSIDHEIQRILSRLTQNVSKFSEQILVNLQCLAQLDLIFAKGKYSLAIDAGQPNINTTKQIFLKMARHPILVKTLDQVIPNTINILSENNSLIITGANTGGKTVTLKTIGLCILMTSVGLHIPVENDSSIYLFESIYSDIGEEQNLEQNLSTFSSRMTRIINIISQCTEHSLVLIDELGAGTDPEEGTALAQALLEYLNNNKVTTIVTTHYGGLKELAYSHKGFVNASVEFDLDKLKPTYKLLMGIPGQSNATTISKNLGLNETIVSRAKELYLKTMDDKSVMIDELHKIQRETSLKLNKINEDMEQIENNKILLESEYENLNKNKSQIIYSYRKNLLSELDKARKEIIELLDALKTERSEKKARYIHSELANIENTMHSNIDNLKKELDNKKTKYDQIDWNTIAVGDKVFIENLKQEAILLSLPDNKGKVNIQMGLVKSKVYKEELLALRKDKNKQTKIITSHQNSVATKLKREISSNVLDLRGKKVEEGLKELEMFLDRCSLSNVNLIKVIHGHGTGQLRKAVREYLIVSPYQCVYRAGEQSEGGDGVSIIELK